MKLKTLRKIVSVLCGIAIFALSVVLVDAAIEKTPRTVVAPITVIAPTPSSGPTVPKTGNDDEPVSVRQSGPITFTIPMAVWVAWLISIATAIGAIAVIWKFGIKAAGFVTDIANYLPVLREIAKEFKNDAGSTLKDAVDRLELAAEKAQHTADLAQKTASDLGVFMREQMAAAKARDEAKK